MAYIWPNCNMIGLLVITITALFTGASGQCHSYPKSCSATRYWQTIESPNYGISDYSNRLDCKWQIKSLSYDEVVHLYVLEIDLEAGYFGDCVDFLVIYDGAYASASNRIKKICTGKNLQFYSSERYLTVWFKTDYSIRRKGFKLEYKSVPRFQVPFSTSTVWPLWTTTSKPHSESFNTAATIGGPIIALICIICLVAVCRLCCKRASQSNQASAPCRSDSSHVNSQSQLFTLPSSAYTPSHDGHTNAGFSSLGEGPPSYDVVMASNQWSRDISSETQPVAPPSYEEVIMMSENATEPKPE